jgi:uncharacterized membrane protein
MKARAQILGHPVHQMLIPIPVGLFITAAVLDIVAMIAGWRLLTFVSFWNLVIGVAIALIAAVFGLIDWTAIPKGTRAKRVGAVHGGGNVVMVGLFFVAVLLRMDEPSFAVTGGALALEVVALLIGTVTVWLGGELVDRHGIGVHPDAHADASSSLRALRHARRAIAEVVDERPLPPSAAPTPTPAP